MAKQVKRKLKIKVLPLLVFILIVLIIVGVTYNLIRIPIRNIYIEDNTYLTDQEIIELAKIDNYPSFLLTFSKSIERNIKRSVYIEKVKVTKSIGAVGVTIKVKEHGVLFRKEENKKIVLSNAKELADKEYRFMVPLLLNYIPDNKYNLFIEGMSKIEPDIRGLISEITYSPNDQDKDRFLLNMSDGNYVYLTLTKFRHLNLYEEVLKRLDGKKGILYLDSGNHFQIIE